MKVKDIYKILKKMNPKLTRAKIVKEFNLLSAIMLSIDKISNFIRRNIGFEINKGEIRKIEQQFHDEIYMVKSKKENMLIFKKFLSLLKSVSLNKPKDKIKIGIVGEFYVLTEPFINFSIEDKLAELGVEVVRHSCLSKIIALLKYSESRYLIKKYLLNNKNSYIKYTIAGEGTDTVLVATGFAGRKYDGIVHLKPFGCIPEGNAMPILNKISENYNIPILYLSLDSQTTESAIKTRLEAFYDMIQMRRQKRNE
jgi:predicted nucleotide-binding protein (sugar kinase/HSP70/actin superfamily)